MFNTERNALELCIQKDFVQYHKCFYGDIEYSSYSEKMHSASLIEYQWFSFIKFGAHFTLTIRTKTFGFE